MISISYEIPPITFAHNPIWLFLQSNNYKIANGNYSQNWFIISSTTNYPVNGTVKFNVLGRTLLFTFKAVPNNSGFELPTRTPAESNIDYAMRLVPYFKRNYFLHGNFDITTSISTPNALIIFSARNFGSQYNFTALASTGVLPGNGLSFTLAGSGSMPAYRPNFKILLQILRGGKIVKEEYLSVDENGFVKVDIKDYFDFHSALGFPAPVALAQNYTAMQQLSFGVAEMYGDPVEVYDFNLYHGYTVIPGGYLEAEFRDRYRLNSTNWTAYRPNHIPQNKFLTAHKGQKETYKQAYEKLTFLALGDLTIDVDVLYTDGTTSSKNLGSISNINAEVWEVNCSVNTLQLEALQPLKSIASYEVKILDFSSNILDSFTFIYNHDKPLYYSQYAYIGRYGNWEFLSTTGGQTVGAKPDFTSYIPVSANNVFSVDTAAKVKQNDTRQSVVGRTGYLNYTDLECLADFFESPKVYEIINGQLYAISDLEGYPSIDQNTEVENVHAFEFTYTRERLPMKNILCSDQWPDLANTFPDTLVECWGQLPPVPSGIPLQAEDGSNLLTEDNLTIEIE